VGWSYRFLKEDYEDGMALSMYSIGRWFLCTYSGALLGGCAGAGPTGPPLQLPPESLSVELVEVVSGLNMPLFLTAPAGDARLFVVEKPGRIRIVDSGQLVATPFLDITHLVSGGGEQGLLSMAFDPDYGANGRFYVSYTDRSGDTRVVRYRVSADPDRADTATADVILSVDQPYSNHNGGLVTFGPDGMMYVGLGDGGSGGDPDNNGQDLGTLLGALLRIDVSGTSGYTVPPDNPFVADPGARGEIWAYGLRNPWRFSFDRTDGVIYIADVGQSSWEEIDAQPSGQGGRNYGWRLMEGDSCFNPSNCDRSGLVLPVVTYPNGSDGCAVVGGYVYRGGAIAGLEGTYFYSDNCAGWVRSFRLVNGEAEESTQWALGSVGSVLSFGEDAAGELYLLTAGGVVYRLAPSD